MDFQEAFKTVKELAEERYFTLNYEITSHGRYQDTPITMVQKCIIYLDGYTHIEGHTWEDAIAKFRICIGLDVFKEENIDDVNSIDSIEAEIQSKI